MPVYTEDTFFVSMQGAIWPSPDSRIWDFTWDPRPQDALMTLLAGLLSKHKQIGEKLPRMSMCLPQTPSKLHLQCWRFPDSPLDASGVSESGPVLPVTQRSAQPVAGAGACLQSYPRRQRDVGGMINNVPEIYMTLQL